MYGTQTLHLQTGDEPEVDILRSADGVPFTIVRPARLQGSYLKADSPDTFRALAGALLAAAGEWETQIRADELRAAREAVA